MEFYFNKRKTMLKWKQFILGGDEEMDIQVGEVIKMKKPHPCGSKEWKVLRVGMDFRLECMGCGHQIMIARKLVEKNMRGKV